MYATYKEHFKPYTKMCSLKTEKLRKKIKFYK